MPLPYESEASYFSFLEDDKLARIIFVQAFMHLSWKERLQVLMEDVGEACKLLGEKFDVAPYMSCTVNLPNQLPSLESSSHVITRASGSRTS